MMRWTITMLAIFATACYPTLPPQLGEGTTHLERGQVDLSVTGGGASFETRDTVGGYVNTTAFGAEVRTRVGIGAKSEVGLSVFGGYGTAVGNGDPPFAGGAKLSYKVAPLARLAFVIDGGATYADVAGIALFGGDFAIIAAPWIDGPRRQLYVGAKLAFSVPSLQNATNANEAVIAPIGFLLPLGARHSVALEAGPIFGFAQQSNSGASSSTNSFGGYASMTFTFGLRR